MKSTDLDLFVAKGAKRRGKRLQEGNGESYVMLEITYITLHAKKTLRVDLNTYRQASLHFISYPTFQSTGNTMSN